MSEQVFNTRIVHKHDTEANWTKAINFIPKTGELIVYDVDENYNYPRVKIGDGVTAVSDLVFIDENKVDKNDLLQADWRQTDEMAIDFIKNKPDRDDALVIVTEMGFVEPIAAADGSIYTDENGAIYTLI